MIVEYMWDGTVCLVPNRLRICPWVWVKGSASPHSTGHSIPLSQTAKPGCLIRVIQRGYSWKPGTGGSGAGPIPGSSLAFNGLRRYSGLRKIFCSCGALSHCILPACKPICPWLSWPVKVLASFSCRLECALCVALPFVFSVAAKGVFPRESVLLGFHRLEPTFTSGFVSMILHGIPPTFFLNSIFIIITLTKFYKERVEIVSSKKIVVRVK